MLFLSDETIFRADWNVTADKGAYTALLLLSDLALIVYSIWQGLVFTLWETTFNVTQLLWSSCVRLSVETSNISSVKTHISYCIMYLRPSEIEKIFDINLNTIESFCVCFVLIHKANKTSSRQAVQMAPSWQDSVIIEGCICRAVHGMLTEMFSKTWPSTFVCSCLYFRKVNNLRIFLKENKTV